MAIKGAIFDMDGTLLDSMYVWLGIGCRYLEYKGITPDDEDRELLEVALLAPQAEHFIKKYGFTMAVNEIVDDINKFIEHEYMNNVQMKPGIPELLKDLKSRGVKMCIASLSDRYLIEGAFKRLGFLDYFEDLLSCTVLGCDKTTPFIFEEGIRILGTSKDSTYVFEDSLLAIKTAKRAGFKTVGIRDSWAESVQDKIKEIADFYITTPNELDIDKL
ncbi:MAG: HAD family phosphatase [Ruminococcaceae bacterium]|nr:HAD family phosphatase [Oscillospiraceae bacterium]